MNQNLNNLTQNTNNNINNNQNIQPQGNINQNIQHINTQNNIPVQPMNEQPTTPLNNQAINTVNLQTSNEVQIEPQPTNNINHAVNPQAQIPPVQNNSENNNQKSKIKFIILAILLAVFVIGIFLFISSPINPIGGTKNNTILNKSETLEIKNAFSDIDLKVDSIEENVKLTGLFNTENVFKKVKVTIQNNRDKDSDIGMRNLFKLLDENKNEITDRTCLSKTGMSQYKTVNDAIDDVLSANQVTSGYLYCPDENNKGTILQVTSITGIDEKLLRQGKLKSTSSDKFYINLG